MRKFFTSMIMLALIVALLPNTAWAQDNTTRATELTVITSGSRTNVRTGPGIEYTVVDVAAQGAKFQVLDISQDGDWYQVDLGENNTGWVASWIVNPTRFDSTEQLAPGSATLFFSIDTSRGFFERTEDMLTIFNHESAGSDMFSEFNRLMMLFFQNPDLTVADVRPWLGEDISIVNLQCLSATMSDFLMQDELLETPRPNVVILASIIDIPLAEAFLDRALNTGPMADTPQQEVEYGDLTYTLLNNPTLPDNNADLPVLAMGIIDHYMVFAQGQESYEAIIDVANGGQSLPDDSGFQQVYGELDPEAFMNVYVSPGLFCPVHDPILYNALLSETFQNGQIDIAGLDGTDPEALQAQIINLLDNTFEGYGVSFRNIDDTMQLDLVSGVDIEKLQALTGLDEDQIQEIVTQSGFELFGFLTPATLEVLTFGNLSETYDALSTVSAATPETTFENSTGLSRDLLQWLDGSITMGFIDYPVYDPTGDVPSFFLMVVEPSIPDNAQEDMDALIDAAKQQKQNVQTQSTTDASGVEVTTITSGPAEARDVLQIAMVDGYVVMATGENMERVLTDARRTADGRFMPDWRLLAGLPVTQAAESADEAPFVAALDLGKTISGGGESNIQAAAIVSPALTGNGPSRITIICSICRRGDLCWTDR